MEQNPDSDSFHFLPVVRQIVAESGGIGCMALGATTIGARLCGQSTSTVVTVIEAGFFPSPTFDGLRPFFSFLFSFSSFALFNCSLFPWQQVLCPDSPLIVIWFLLSSE